MSRFRLSFSERRRRTAGLEVRPARSDGVALDGDAHRRGGTQPGRYGAGRPGRGSFRGSAVLRARWPRADESARRRVRWLRARPAHRATAPNRSPSCPKLTGGGGGGVRPTSPRRELRRRPVPRGVRTRSPSSARSAWRTTEPVAPVGISAPWKPAQPTGNGGGALPPRGGSGGGSAVRPSYAAQARSANPAQGSGASSSGASASSASALLLTLGLNGTAAVIRRFGRGHDRHPQRAGSPAPWHAGPGTHHGRRGRAHAPTFAGLHPDHLDYNDGSVFVPGAEQLATPGGSVDLRAQVIDSASGTYTYSWTTSGLTDATSISGASSYDLTFQWNTSISTATAESTTLTVTDPDSNQVSQTYTFWVPGDDRHGHRRHHLALVARPRPDPGRRPGRGQPERLGRLGHRRRRDRRSTCPASTPTSRRSRSSTTRWPPTRCRSSTSSTRSARARARPRR